jgi:hypothetical protein
MNTNERVNARDSVGATMLFGAVVAEQLQVKGRYTARCFGPIESRRAEFNALRDRIAAEELIADSSELARLRAELELIPIEEKWFDTIENLVPTAGKNLVCEGALGNAAQGAVAMGLKGSGTPAAGDTMASHATWSEITNFAARLTPSFSAASGGTKATSATVNFAFTSGSGVTVAGCFVVVGGSTTIGNTSGTLLSAGDFSGGNKIASTGDTVQVTYSLSV